MYPPELEFVKFSDLLDKLGVTETKSTQGSSEVTSDEVKKIISEVENLQLPNHVKYAILAGLEAAEELKSKNIKYVKYSDISGFVKERYPITKVICFDANYYTCDSELLRDLLSSVMSSKLTYVDDRFDCDNFAEYVSSMMALLYGINTVGRCAVMLVSADDLLPKVLGLHMCNMVVSANSDSVWLYEPQLDKVLDGLFLHLKTKDGKDLDILYVPMFVIFG